MNGNYGKFLQNKLGQTQVNTFTDQLAWLRAVWRRNCVDYSILHNDDGTGNFLGLVEYRKRKAVCLNTLRFQGLVTLEWSKIVMLEFHYDIIKKYFGDAAKLMFTDTDSFFYYITLTARIIEEFGLDPENLDKVTAYDLIAHAQKLCGVFDLSSCDPKCPNKGILGKIKLEVGDEEIKVKGVKRVVRMSMVSKIR